MVFAPGLEPRASGLSHDCGANFEGVVAGEVLGHFQSRAKVPLSKVPNPHLAQSTRRWQLTHSLWLWNSSGPNQRFGIAVWRFCLGPNPETVYDFTTKINSICDIEIFQQHHYRNRFKPLYLDKLEELNLKREKRCLLLHLSLTCLLHLYDF